MTIQSGPVLFNSVPYSILRGGGQYDEMFKFFVTGDTNHFFKNLRDYHLEQNWKSKYPEIFWHWRMSSQNKIGAVFQIVIDF